jgi:hypothetical protein
LPSKDFTAKQQWQLLVLKIQPIPSPKHDKRFPSLGSTALGSVTFMPAVKWRNPSQSSAPSGVIETSTESLCAISSNPKVFKINQKNVQSHIGTPHLNQTLFDGEE